MFKKILGIILDIILISLVIGVIYYFLNSNKDNTMISNELLSFSPNYEDDALTSQALTNLNVINETSNYSNTSSSSTNNKYYYNQLGYNAKLIYTGLENNIDNLKKDNFKINFSTKFNDLLNQQNGKSILDRSFQAALDAFFYDHPELFYIDLTKITLYTKYTTKLLTKLNTGDIVCLSTKKKPQCLGNTGASEMISMNIRSIRSNHL